MKQLSESGLTVLERRYLKRDDMGNVIETPEELFMRVATVVASAESHYPSNLKNPVEYWTNQFFDIISSLDFLPNSPTLMNAGLPLGQLSACFVLPIEDSIDDIFNRVRDTAIIHKTGGGTGFSFSRIRPDGSMVSTTKGSASGPLSFMHAFDAATGTIAQGGKRRGANMGMLRVDHPDIMEFITVKNDLKQLNNFNISVAITEEFMHALHNHTTYDLVDPHSKQVTGQLEASMVWNTIVESAWKTGEPGIIFIDRVNESNHLKPLYGEIEATNPCLAGDTPITIRLEDGTVKEQCIETLEDQDVEVWNGYEWSKTTVRCTGKKLPLMTILFSNGRFIRCTRYHKFLMCTGQRKEAKNLFVGDVLAPWNLPDGGGESVYITNIINDDAMADKVYCLNEPIRHAFMANGVVVGNCGEQPLLPWEACNLGSINLANFVTNPDGPVYSRTVDYARLTEVVKIAVRFLDDVIDVNKYPLPQIRDMCNATRKIGLGVMGFADMLHMLQIPYDSEQALNLANSIMGLIQEVGHATSRELAGVRKAYPAYYELREMYDTGAIKDEPKMERNAAITTIAPTGSISAIAGVSSGIEPLFANVFYKHVMDGDNLPVVNEHLMHDMHTAGVWSPELEEKIKNSASIADFEEIPEYIRRVYVCSHDISPTAHVQMQATFQKHVDNAISKTVNFNESATQDDIRSTYELAYQLGCKGITVYRNNCRQNQVLNIGTVDKPQNIKVVPDGGIAPEMAKVILDAIAANWDGLRNEVMDLYETSQDFYTTLGDIASSDECMHLLISNRLTPAEIAHLLAIKEPKLMELLMQEAEFNLRNSKDTWNFAVRKDTSDEEFVDFMRKAVQYMRPDLTMKMFEGIPEKTCFCGTGECKCEQTNPAPGIRMRPESLEGYTKCVKINCGKLYVTVNHDDLHQLFEVFTTNGKGGGCPAQSEAVCRLASLALRSGVAVEDIVRQLRGIKCTACLKNPDVHVLSCPDAIGRELESEQKRLLEIPDDSFTDGDATLKFTINIPEPHPIKPEVMGPPELHYVESMRMYKGDKKTHDEITVDGQDICPSCGAKMHHEGGCVSCNKCGYSNCG